MPSFEPVGGDGVGRLDDPQAQVGGVDAEIDSDLVELHLEAEAGLRRAVPALGPAGGLVGEGADRLELVVGEPVGDGLERAGVVGRGDAVAAEGAAVEGGLERLRGERAVVLDTGLHPHRHRVAAAVAVEDLLAGERDLRRAAELQRHGGADDLVAEGVALAAEAAAVGGRDDANARRRQAEHLGEGAVEVVRRLGRRVDRQSPLVLGHGDRRVLLHRQMGVAVVEEEVVVDPVGRGEARLDVAELHRDDLVQVAAVGVGVELRLSGGDRLFDRGDRRQRLVVDLDGERRSVRSVLGECRDRDDRVADVADHFDRQGVLVLRDREDAEGGRQVGAGENADDTGQRARLLEPDRANARVRQRRADELDEDLAWKSEVVSEAGLAGYFGVAVDAPEGRADDAELALLARRKRRGVADGIAHRAPSAAGADSGAKPSARWTSRPSKRVQRTTTSESSGAGVA